MKNFWVILLIFCLVLGLRLCAITHKDFVHHDEPFTFYGATPANSLPDKDGKFKKSWDKYDIEYDKVYNTKEIKKSFFGSDSSFKSLFRDLKEIHSSNIDSSHPVLYYSLFRIFNTGYDGSDWQKGLVRGYFLNLLLFSLSFFFLYKMLNLIKPDDTKLISLGLFFGFCNTGSISNTILLREYAVAELFFNISLFLLVKIYKQIKDNKDFSVLQIITYSLIFALAVQTGYFTLIFELIIALIILILLICNKKYKFTLRFSLLMLFSYLWTIAIYPKYFVSLLNNSHFNNVINIILNYNIKFRDFIHFYQDYIFYQCLFVIILIYYLLIMFRKTDKSINLLHLPILAVIIWNLIIINICPVSDLRFILPSFPALSLIFVFLIYSLKEKYIKIILTAYFLLSINPIFNDESRLSNIEYLHHDWEIEYLNNKPLEHKNLPIYLYVKKGDNPWFYTYMIFCHTENENIIFTQNLPPKTNKDFYLMYYTKNSDKQLSDNPEVLISLGPEAFHGYYSIYYIDKNITP